MPYDPDIGCHGSVSVRGVDAAASSGNWSGQPAAQRIGGLSARLAMEGFIQILPSLRGSSPGHFKQEVIMKDGFDNLMNQTGVLGSLGAAARKQGEEVAADAYFRDALAVALNAANHAADGGSHPGQLDALRAAARFALDCGEVPEARRLVEEASS